MKKEMRFDAIKQRLLQLAEQADDIKAIIEIGSQARTYERADEYSDLDLLFVTDKPEEYLDRDDRLAQIDTIKKIFRGEIWTAKMCIDSYMKGQLLRMMEWYHKSIYGAEYDVWHDGRFLEKWADKDIVKKLEMCFAHYNKKELKKAVVQTADLFAEMAKVCAEKNEYTYPVAAEEYAKSVIS